MPPLSRAYLRAWRTQRLGQKTRDKEGGIAEKSEMSGRDVLKGKRGVEVGWWDQGNNDQTKGEKKEYSRYLHAPPRLSSPSRTPLSFSSPTVLSTPPHGHSPGPATHNQSQKIFPTKVIINAFNCSTTALALTKPAKGKCFTVSYGLLLQFNFRETRIDPAQVC